MEHPPRLRWSDAWLLTAIYQRSREVPADLVDILAAADFINHAVPNPEELESALVRLGDAGLIERAGEGLHFVCTAEARATIEDVSGGAETVYDLWKQLEHRLDVVPWTPGESLPHPDNSQSYPGFDADVYKVAVEAYLKRMRGK